MIVAEGDRVILWDQERDKRAIVEANSGKILTRLVGDWNPAKLIGLEYGTSHEFNGKRWTILPPYVEDLHASIARNAAIIIGKDLSRIMWELGLRPGAVVYESGIGSGASTISLAETVGDGGKVLVQELREEFATWSMENLRAAGLDHRVIVKIGDAGEGVHKELIELIPDEGLHGALLDQPEPWHVIPELSELLRPGARIVAYTPQVVQMEQAARSMRAAGLVDVRAFEIIERQWEVKELGSRPSFDGLGHTAFLTVGRKVAPELF